MKDREERQSCCFSARVKQGLRWLDAQIANHSSRGLMLRMPMPPSAGSFIEIRRGDKVMIGQVRWSRDGQCGVQLRDRITTATLRDIPGHMTATRRTTPTGEYVERRATVRTDCPIAWHFQRADLWGARSNASDWASWSSWALRCLPERSSTH
ncbi:MAG: PilZ domain-containing protein [Sphingobium sp.]|nr:PilZ domain-containing protein [Sphingobium sp.]